MFDAGFRMMSMTHFFDTFAGGSASGETKTGLTRAGLAILRRMEARGMMVDLAHASPTLVDDILAAATRPVVVSHTGVTATCDNNRNLTDAQLRRIAANGGVVGIGYFEAAVCETSAASIARAIRHTADVAGIEHVALGSDFDGATVTPFDASGLVQITEALLAEGYSEQEVRLIMGGNVVSLLLRLLPP
jgi:microsomal dipeptidase-like Zn-dependent dipeptidase